MNFSFTLFKTFLVLLIISSLTYSQTGFIMGDFGTLIKTTDGGNSWAIKETGMVQTLFKSYFVDNNTGWIAGGTTTRFVISTTDQGETWSQQLMINNGTLRSIWFSTAANGFAVGSYGTVLKTTNSGANWDSITVGSGNAQLETVCFPSASTGFITGTNGSFFKSTNSGINWTALNTNTTANLYASYFRSVRMGWIGGSGGIIQETTNGGTNWTVQSTGTTQDLYSIFFFNNALGWSVGHQGTILKTTNEGVTWSPQTSPSNISLESVYFSNQLTGWAAGGSDGSVVLNTTDGGNSWNIQSSITSQHLYASWFFETPLGIKQIPSTSPGAFSLSQNYPNPFNPSTKIKFEIPNSKSETNSKIEIRIYDVLGKEVATLVSGKLQPGTYEITWNAYSYPSGVYFYELTAGDFRQSKTMVLIK